MTHDQLQDLVQEKAEVPGFARRFVLVPTWHVNHNLVKVLVNIGGLGHSDDKEGWALKFSRSERRDLSDDVFHGTSRIFDAQHQTSLFSSASCWNMRNSLNERRNDRKDVQT